MTQETVKPTAQADAQEIGDPATCHAQLHRRYMKSTRDELFIECLQEILVTDSAGTITPEPIRVGNTRETRGLAVVGESGAGKSMLIHRNLQLLEGITVTDGSTPGEALHLMVPAEATLKSVAISILEATGYGKVSPQVRVHEAWEMAAHRLHQFGYSILWIDEAHHLMRGASGRDVATVLQRLKNLLQGTHAVTVILSGVPALHERMQDDPETSRRFFRLWLNPIDGGTDRLRLKDYIGRLCQDADLAPVDDPALVDRLLMACGGSLGRSIELTLVAMRRAMRNKEKMLTLGDFRRARQLQTGSADAGPFAEMKWAELKKKLEKKGWNTECD